MRFSKVIKVWLLGLIFVNFWTSGLLFAENEKFVYNIKPHQPLELAPYNTQLLFENGQLNALSIIQGKIHYFKESINKWIELQRFGPYDMNFTTFEIKDLNGDNIPEIIAGTEDPGLIYLYTHNNDQWDLISYGKHVWSTINKIIIGNLTGDQAQEFLVQNDEGYLFLLKASGTSLDLIWKSPILWQSISSAVVADIDHDFLDEIMVVYKTGGIGVLKVENNAVTSVWENYPWGKVLGVTVGDWDNDQQNEVIFSTSQKLLYILGRIADKYAYEGQFSEFDYIIEKLAFISDHEQERVLVTTNTAGMLKIVKYEPQKNQWVEQFSYNTGRVVLVFQSNQEQTFLWSVNRKLIDLSLYKSIPLQVKFQGVQYQFEPNALSFKDRIYIAPKTLSKIAGLEIAYNEQTQTFSIKSNKQLIEISKNEPNTIKVNGASTLDVPMASIVLNNEVYLSLEIYKTFFDLNLSYNPSDRLILIS